MTYNDLSPKLKRDYSDLDEESKRAELVKDDGGVIRFKARDTVAWCVGQRGVSLNDFWVAAVREKWPVRDVMQFYRDMGYSLCGFTEIFSDERIAELGE